MAKFGITKKPYDYLAEIALRHKTLRKQAGFSQSELAKRSGVSLGSLKRFETTGQISLESLLKLMEMLDRLHDFDLVLKPVENLKEIEKLFSDKTRI
ncbi:MAG: helix-turn-helix transcriptional regulator [Saprospiraceae bacterium]|nr:helix-turn-helix transcriptional regulator [Saprospiraceae bacterium]MDZ4703540.1 helix-turn-helix transcriptional regulator [Saprospiraceae bacterium]